MDDSYLETFVENEEMINDLIDKLDSQMDVKELLKGYRKVNLEKTAAVKTNLVVAAKGSHKMESWCTGKFGKYWWNLILMLNQTIELCS